MTLLNILQTCYSRSWGGLEMQALEVSRHLARRGHTVWVSAPPGSRLDLESRDAGLQTLPRDIRGYLHPFVMLDLARTIRRLGIQLIHSHHSRDLATLSPSLRLVHPHIPLLLSKRMGSGIRKTDLLHRFTYARVDRVLAISTVIRENVLATTPMPPDRVLLLFDAIDTTRFSPSQVRDREATRRSFGIRPEEFLIGCVGRLSPGKGHEELLEAARILRSKGHSFRVLIVGEASYGERPYEDRIRSLSTSLQLDSTVIFSGFRRDVPQVMAALDIFAFPSHAEAFGLVLIEAMAMERPVVSTNCDGVVDIMMEGVTGLTVPPKDAAALAAALERMLTDEGLRKRCGAAARARVLERFDQQRQIDRLELLYAELMAVAQDPVQPPRSASPPDTH